MMRSPSGRSSGDDGALKATLLSVLLAASAASAQDGGADGGPLTPALSPQSQGEGERVMQVESFEGAEGGPLTPTLSPALRGEGAQGVDAGPPPAESFIAPSGPSVRVYGSVRGEVSVDSRFDSPRNVPMAENVAEGCFKATLGADVKWNEHIRLVLEGRAQVRLVTQRDFDRAKGFFEPMLGDAYLDVYTSKVDVRVGNQRIALGANAAMAPADALNPRDLRESFMAGDLEDALLPVFAVRAQGELGQVKWLAAYAPFFTPHKYTVFGQDEALLQPGLGPVFDTRRIDPSIEDHIQDSVLETKRPVPFAGDVALRVVSTGKFRLGGSWVWMNEKLPRVTMDPELSAVLSAQAAGRQVDPAMALSVLNRFQAGETLYAGEYRRSHLFSLEGSTILGPGQLDVDVTYSPRTTYFDDQFRPIDKSTVTWVIGYSQASDSPLVYAISYMGMAVPDVAAQQQLILIEPATAVGGARTAFLHLFLGSISYPVWKDRFELSLRAAFEPIQRSFALGPKVTFQGVEGLKIWVAGEIYGGPSWSPLGYFHRNSKVLVGLRWDPF